MHRPPFRSAVLTSMALLHCAAVLLATVAVDASLRFRGGGQPIKGRPALAADMAKSPCAVWLQEHSGESLSAIVHSGQAPCPCLVTPAPLMSPQQLREAEVRAAADDALVKGMAKIELSAEHAAQPVKDALSQLDAKEVEEAARNALDEVERNQTGFLKQAMETERVRQEQELAKIEADATSAAAARTQQLRVHAEQLATKQAKDYIYMWSNGPIGQAMASAQRIDAKRQQSAEFAKSAIKSAGQTLEVAEKAQQAIAMVPKDAFVAAAENAKKSQEEQAQLSSDFSGIEARARDMAVVAKDSYADAVATLQKATEAEKVARKALETSRSNAAKIELLKERAQKVSNRAIKAEEAHQASQA